MRMADKLSQYDDRFPDLFVNQPPASIVPYAIISIEVVVFALAYVYVELEFGPLSTVLSGQHLSESQGSAVAILTYVSNTIVMLTLSRDAKDVRREGTNLGYLESSPLFPSADDGDDDGDDFGAVIVWLLPSGFLVLAVYWLVRARPKAFEFGDVVATIERQEERIVDLEIEYLGTGTDPRRARDTLEHARDTLEHARRLLGEQNGDEALRVAERATTVAEREGGAVEHITDARHLTVQAAEAVDYDADAVPRLGHDASTSQVDVASVDDPAVADADATGPRGAVAGAVARLASSHEKLRQRSFDAAVDEADRAKRLATETLDRLVDVADDAATDARARVENGEHSAAVDRWDEALQTYDRAMELAEQFDRRTETIRQRIADAEEERRLTRLEIRLADLEERLDAGDLSAAEDGFEELVDELEAVDADAPTAVQALGRRARRGHVRTLAERGRRKHDRAARRFEDGNYYEAREAFEEGREFLEPVLSLASTYGLPEEKETLLRLDGLCALNADRARRALYSTGDETPDLASLADVDAGDVAPPGEGSGAERPWSGDRREASRTRADEVEHGSFAGRESGDDVGRSIPDHDRLDLIGSGGNADVWHVRLVETGDEAALKLPRWEGTLSKDVVERFRREAETWSRIDDHENVVTVYDWGFAARPWLLMEFLVGGDLRPHVGTTPLDRALDLLVQVANALQHARGVDHLDVKPANVLLDGDGTAKLADWGLARVAFRHEQTNTRMGVSPPYAAPEQIDRARGDVDHRTDIYQLGVTAYELVTGRLPFDPEKPESLERRILRGNPVPPSTITPSLPDALDDVVLTAMAAERSERYETVVQFRHSIEALIENVA